MSACVIKERIIGDLMANGVIQEENVNSSVLPIYSITTTTINGNTTINTSKYSTVSSILNKQLEREFADYGITAKDISRFYFIRNNQLMFADSLIEDFKSKTGGKINASLKEPFLDVKLLDQKKALEIMNTSKVKTYISQRYSIKNDLLNLQKRYTQELYTNSNKISKAQKTELQRKLSLIKAELSEIEFQIKEYKENKTAYNILKDFTHDMELVERALNGDKTIPTELVNKLIDFYDHISNTNENELLEALDAYDEKGALKYEFNGLKDILFTIKSKVVELKNKQEIINKKMAAALIQENTNYVKEFGDIIDENGNISQEAWDKAFYKNGLPDINAFDKWLMNPTNSFGQSNGMIPQIMQMILDAEINRRNVDVRNLIEELNKTVPDAERVLRTKFKDKMWNIFYAFTKTGLKTENIITPYSHEYYEELAKASAYRRSLKEKALKLNDKKKIREALIGADVSYLKRLLSFNTVFNPTYIEAYYRAQGIEITEAIKKQLEAYHALGEQTYGKYAYRKALEEAETKYDLFQLERISKQDELINRYNLRHGKQVTDIQEVLQDNEFKKEWDIFIKEKDPKALHDAYMNYIQNDKTSLAGLSKDYAVLMPNTKGVLDEEAELNGEENKYPDFYSKQFKEIENDPKLMAFYELLYKNQQLIKDLLPAEKQQELGNLSLMSMQKTFAETLSDPDIKFMTKLSLTIKHLWDKIVGFFTKDVSDRYTIAYYDPITKQKKLKVDDSWFKTNKSHINAVMNKYLDEYALMLARHRGAKGGVIKFKFNSSENLLAHEDIATFNLNNLSTLLGVPPTKQAIEAKLGMSLSKASPVAIYKKAVIHSIMQEQSIDLPKVLTYQLYQASLYRARLDAKPYIENLKKYYTAITTDKNGLRERAIEQIDAWFNRNVLGGYEDSVFLGKSEEESLKDEESTVNKKRFYTKKDKKKLEDIDRMKSILEELKRDGKIEEDDYNSRIKKLDKEKKYIGRYFSITKTMSSATQGMRFVALGYNISAQYNNYMEGQLSNLLMAEKGHYFNTDQYYRAKRIMMGNIAHVITNRFTKTPVFDSAAKVKYIMGRYDVMQDTENILQKASQESAVDKISDKLNPYAFQKRTEFHNQGQILIAMLLNEEIKGIDSQGNEITSSVWDALNSDGTLKEGFNTEENINTWVNNTSKEFHNFKIKVSKAIIEAHGDYSNTQGNLLREYAEGKMLLALKNWMIRNTWSRFGSLQYDLESQQWFKGRYRSLTRGSIIGMTTIAGLAFNPFMAIAGLAAGTALSFAFGINSNVSLLQELADFGKNVALNMLRAPLNILTNTNVISQGKSLLEGQDVSEVDVRNLKAFYMEAALQLWLLLGVLMLKGLANAAADDDEGIGADEKVLNYLINRTGSMLDQSISYTNPYSFYKTNLSSMMILSYFSNLSDLGKEIGNYFSNKDSKIEKELRGLILPSLVRDASFSGFSLGFGSLMSKDFYQTYYNELFISDDTKAQRIKKNVVDELKAKISSSDLSDEEKEIAEKTLKKLVRKRKSESKLDNAKRVEENVDTLSQRLGI